MVFAHFIIQFLMTFRIFSYLLYIISITSTMYYSSAYSIPFRRLCILTQFYIAYLHTFLQRPLGIVWPCLWPLSTITNISTHTYLYYKYIRDDPNCVKACHLLHLRWKKKNITAASTKQSSLWRKEKNLKKLWFLPLR